MMKRKLIWIFFSVYLFLIACFLVPCNKTLAQTVSSAECVMEIDSRRILYEEHGDVRLPMASTTKIVTAICVLESGIDLNSIVKIPKSAVGTEGSSVYLKEGEEYSVMDLLFGLMLRSGNDCAVTLAEHLDGTVERFSSRMNSFAQEAGALNSRFSNPHGLPMKNHYTTAVDLSFITALAMQNPTFCKIVSTKYYEPRNWVNKNKMLTTYEGAIGVKTGFTKQAGRCLVTAAEKDGMRLVVTVLNSPNMYERTKTLLDGAFAKFQKKLLLGSKQVVSFEGIEGITGQDYYYPMMEGEEEHVEIVARKKSCPQNEKIVGEFEIYLLKRLLFSGNLYKL